MNKLVLQPTGDRIVVRAKKAEEVTKGGLYIPEMAREKTMEGVVLAVGPGVRLEDGSILPLDIVADDRVLFNKHAVVEVQIDEEDLIIIREIDVLGVLRSVEVADEEAETPTAEEKPISTIGASFDEMALGLKIA